MHLAELCICRGNFFFFHAPAGGTSAPGCNLGSSLPFCPALVPHQMFSAEFPVHSFSHLRPPQLRHDFGCSAEPDRAAAEADDRRLAHRVVLPCSPPARSAPVADAAATKRAVGNCIANLSEVGLGGARDVGDGDSVLCLAADGVHRDTLSVLDLHAGGSGRVLHRLRLATATPPSTRVEQVAVAALGPGRAFGVARSGPVLHFVLVTAGNHDSVVDLQSGSDANATSSSTFDHDVRVDVFTGASVAVLRDSVDDVALNPRVPGEAVALLADGRLSRLHLERLKQQRPEQNPPTCDFSAREIAATPAAQISPEPASSASRSSCGSVVYGTRPRRSGANLGVHSVTHRSWLRRRASAFVVRCLRVAAARRRPARAAF